MPRLFSCLPADTVTWETRPGGRRLIPRRTQDAEATERSRRRPTGG
mgnify:CR=1 FL=1